MDFLKKNYEKILMGVVLFGLAVAVAFLPVMVGNEKARLADLRNSIINRVPKPLDDVDMNPAENLLKRATTPITYNFSDSTHKLFNPERWQRSADGKIFKNPVGTDLEKLVITGITPLTKTIKLESANSSDLGMRYVIVVDDEGAEKSSDRHHAYYMSVGKTEKEDPFTLVKAEGPADNPIVQLQFKESGDTISVSKQKPYQQVDGHMADMKYPPENRTYNNRRVGDQIVVAGELYNIVAITENEVVLSAKSNQKKWTIKYHAG